MHFLYQKFLGKKISLWYYKPKQQQRSNHQEKAHQEEAPYVREWCKSPDCQRILMGDGQSEDWLESNLWPSRSVIDLFNSSVNIHIDLNRLGAGTIVCLGDRLLQTIHPLFIHANVQGGWLTDFLCRWLRFFYLQWL